MGDKTEKLYPDKCKDDMSNVFLKVIAIVVLNVAAGKAPMQSSVAEGGIPQKAVDGSTSTFYDPSTCSLTEVPYTSLHMQSHRGTSRLCIPAHL